MLLKVGILFGLKNKYAGAVGAISTNDWCNVAFCIRGKGAARVNRDKFAS